MLQNIYMALTGHLEEEIFAWITVTVPEKITTTEIHWFSGLFLLFRSAGQTKNIFSNHLLFAAILLQTRLCQTLKTEAEERVDL